MRWRDWLSFNHKRYDHLDPDEVFLDASNLPSFDKQQFEDQLERPISKTAVSALAAIFTLIFIFLLGRVAYLEVVKGEAFATRSESNNLRHTPIFAERGIIYDRNEKELAWNDPDRVYANLPGLAHVLGFVGYPDEEQAKETEYDHKEVVGRSGVEAVYNDWFSGTKGIKIEETDVAGKVVSNYLLTPPRSGKSLKLSVDSRVQSELYSLIKSLALDKGFNAGSGVIMDVKTGELLAATSYPEYDPNAVVVGKDKEAIASYFNNPQSPFLNRVINGLYTPGSIIKPLMAVAALSEKTISPDKIIVSTGALTVPNPYDPKHPSVFKDWKAHGPVDMRRGIAVSSNVYFYVLGGGFGNQPGLGITKIDEYATRFGLAAPTGLLWGQEAAGVIPTPEWKRENFEDGEWRLGDTYHTVIGQYGFLVTPIQIVRAIAAIANGGQLLTPTLVHEDIFNRPVVKNLGLRAADLRIVKEGMRLGVQEGTAQGLSVTYVKVAAKTGTAELGVSKDRVNAWVTGFFPYDNPRYSFVVVMEKGDVHNTVGGVFVMRQLLDWMQVNTPEYFETSVASS